MTIASTILSQMGGMSRLSAMVGANNFIDHGNAVSFRFQTSKIANYIKITLDPSDTYSVEFGKVWGRSYKVVKQVNMVYCDQLIELFENTTKSYLTL